MDHNKCLETEPVLGMASMGSGSPHAISHRRYHGLHSDLDGTGDMLALTRAVMQECVNPGPSDTDHPVVLPVEFIYGVFARTNMSAE
jgi:hypothetical protein